LSRQVVEAASLGPRPRLQDYDRAIEQATRIGARLGGKVFNTFEATSFTQAATHALEDVSRARL